MVYHAWYTCVVVLEGKFALFSGALTNSVSIRSDAHQCFAWAQVLLDKTHGFVSACAAHPFGALTSLLSIDTQRSVLAASAAAGAT